MASIPCSTVGVADSVLEVLIPYNKDGMVFYI